MLALAAFHKVIIKAVADFEASATVRRSGVIPRTWTRQRIGPLRPQSILSLLRLSTPKVVSAICLQLTQFLGRLEEEALGAIEIGERFGPFLPIPPELATVEP